MYWVYILESIKNQRRYIGHAQNVRERLNRHNQGAVRSTRYGRPWKIIYTEHCQTKSEAYRREMEIKRYKGGVQLQQLLSPGKSRS